MAQTLFTPDDLASRLGAIVRNGRPVAYCVGSGLTAPRVPGVAAALELMKHSLGQFNDDAAAFDAAVAGKSGGPAYQAAAELIIGRRGQASLNAVVREMVLQAHRPTLSTLGTPAQEDFTDDYCERAERDVANWYLPAAVTEMAGLLVAEAEHQQARVITTNFDPLIEIAVQRAGGTCVTLKFDQDGSLEDLLSGQNVLVAHLHGFWRNGDTLHVSSQLTQERPALQRSLEGVLSDRTVVVSGYGGWDDVFTAALAEAVRYHRGGELDVIWVFRDDDEREIAAKYSDFFRHVAPASTHVTFFRGVDCESLLQRIRLTRESQEVTDDSTDTSSPLPGWFAPTAAFLANQDRDLEVDDLVRFFDGQIPTWRHVQAGAISMLDLARRTETAIADGSSRLNVVLLQGPSGEGKSMAALQVAAQFAEQEGWRVLWREAGVDSIIDLNLLDSGEWRWLLVLDDADPDVDECFAAVRKLHEQGRDDVSILLVARTTDWREVRAQAKPWSEFAQFDLIETGGLSDADASAVVASWEAAGTDGLGRLSSLPDREQRVQALIAAARDQAPNPDGSFFGGMLRVRFGDGLRDHVRTLGERLSSRQVDSGRSLLEAFLYIAALHSHGILSLQPVTLATALAIKPEVLYRDVVWPLGEEAVLAGTETGLQTRHRAIAEAAMGLVSDWGEDPAEIYYRIIWAAAKVRRNGIHVPDLPGIVYLADRMISDRRVAVRAAQAPVEVEPERISYGTSLAAILRKSGDAAGALREVRKAFEYREEAPDKNKLRGMVQEWAVCAGVVGRPASNAFLCMVAVSNHPGGIPCPISDTDITYAATGILESLGRLASDADWARAALDKAAIVGRSMAHGVQVDDAGAIAAAFEAAARGLTPLLEEDMPVGTSDGAGLTFSELTARLSKRG